MFDAEVSLARMDLDDEVYLLAIVRDVSERKKAEQALRLSEEKLRAIFDNAPYTISINRLEDGTYLEANKAFLRNRGIDREELANMKSTDYALLSEDQIAVIRDRLRKDGAVSNMEATIARRDGSLAHIVYSSVLLNIQGEKQVLSMTVDVTDRKAAELALQRSEEELRRIVAQQSLLLNFLPMAFYTAAASDKYGIAWISDQVSRITGFTSEQFINDSRLWRSRIHPEDKAAVLNIFDGIKTTDPVFAEYRWQHADGSYHWFQDNAVLVCDKDGAPGDIIGSWLDITGQKKAESERKALQQQLMHAQKMEAIGTLAAGIAHDFNNILFPMTGYLEMVIKQLTEGDPFFQKISLVLEGARRAGDLVRQILSITRMTEEKSRPLKIGLIIKEAAILFRSSLPASIDIQTEIDMNHGNIVADPIHIHQIVMNLVVNAYHAMQETGGKVRIILREEAVGQNDSEHLGVIPGKYVKLSVSDTGIGMTPEVVEKIFEPYYTTKEAGRGTGLGLFVVHGLVKQYGGAVVVDSVPGMGTDFHIFLPLSGRAGHEKSKRCLHRDNPDLAGHECILVVDDEEMITRMIRDYLQVYGYRVLTCNNSTNALEMIQSEAGRDVDLLITDNTMPGISGQVLSRKIHVLYPDLPIILYSGFSDQITSDEMKLAGICRNLLKSTAPLEVIKTVREVFDGRPE